MDAEMMNLLGQCPLFVGFHEGQLESLLKMVQINEFEPGETIVEEGTLGDSLFVLIDGAVDVEKTTPDGPPLVLITLDNRGVFFGEMAIVDVRPRSATVRAKVKTRLISVTKDTLYILFDEYPELMILVLANIAKVLAERLRSVDETMSVLSG
jgi:CRP-like cAMP-binding protein